MFVGSICSLPLVPRSGPVPCPLYDWTLVSHRMAYVIICKIFSHLAPLLFSLRFSSKLWSALSDVLVCMFTENSYTPNSAEEGPAPLVSHCQPECWSSEEALFSRSDGWYYSGEGTRLACSLSPFEPQHPIWSPEFIRE